MVNANRTDWDTKLHAALWAYRTAYKVTTKHTPFSLVFGTEALLPMVYLHPDVYKKNGVKKFQDISVASTRVESTTPRHF
jgi:hypothetical protein